MRISIKPVIRQVGVYTLGDVADKLVPFILIPILTRALSPDGYGLVGLAVSLFALSRVLVSFSARSCLATMYFKSGNLLSGYIHVLTRLSLISGALLLFILIGLNFLRPDLLELGSVLVGLIVFSAVTQLQVDILLTIYRVTFNAARYVLLQLGATLVNFGSSVFFVVFADGGAEGRIVGFCCASLVAGFVAVSLLKPFRDSDYNYSEAEARVTSFSFPLIPHAVAAWVRSNIDRFFLLYYLDVAAVALYTVAQQFASVISFAVTSFNKAYQPLLFSNLASSHSKAQHSYNQLLLSLVLLLFITVIFAGLCGVGFEYIVGPDFAGGRNYVIVMCLATFFNSGYVLASNHVLFGEKTSTLSKVSLAATFIHVAMSVALVPDFAVWGSVISCLFSYGFMLISILIVLRPPKNGTYASR